MPRHGRKYYDSSFFHVIVQGINKEYIFREERYKKEYMKLLNENKEDTSIEILAYCIMNNHAHLLIYTKAIEEMSKYMKKVNTKYAKYYNYMEKGRVGYVFRDRYVSEPIKDENYLIKCINYIHRNPVKAGMVQKEKEYKYSSYRGYIRGKQIKVINKLLGTKMDIEMIINNEEKGIFKEADGENKKKEIINSISEEEIERIKEDEEKIKETIKILKEEYKVSYKEIREILKISRRKLERLKE